MDIKVLEHMVYSIRANGGKFGGLRKWLRWSVEAVSCRVSLRNCNITEKLIEGIWINSAAYTSITTP